MTDAADRPWLSEALATIAGPDLTNEPMPLVDLADLEDEHTTAVFLWSNGDVTLETRIAGTWVRHGTWTPAHDTSPDEHSPTEADIAAWLHDDDT